MACNTPYREGYPLILGYKRASCVYGEHPVSSSPALHILMVLMTVSTTDAIAGRLLTISSSSRSRMQKWSVPVLKPAGEFSLSLASLQRLSSHYRTYPQISESLHVSSFTSHPRSSQSNSTTSADRQTSIMVSSRWCCGIFLDF